MLWLEDSKLFHISFTGPKSYLVWDAKVCILATEDTYLVIWWGRIILSKTLPQTLQDMWPAPAGRWTSPFTAVWFLRNTWKVLPAVDHVKKNLGSQAACNFFVFLFNFLLLERNFFSYNWSKAEYHGKNWRASNKSCSKVPLMLCIVLPSAHPPLTNLHSISVTNVPIKMLHLLGFILYLQCHLSVQQWQWFGKLRVAR